MRKPNFEDRVTREKLRYIKNKEIEEYAEDVLLHYNSDLLENPQPINWEDFLENYLKCEIDYAHIANHPTTNEEILGVCSFSDDETLPIYNMEFARKEARKLKTGDIVLHSQLENQPARLRFTALHEGGHWAVHQNYYFSLYPIKNQISMFNESETRLVQCCRIKDVESKSTYRRNFTFEERLEQQANVFASAIVMPKKAVLNVVIPALFKKYKYRPQKEGVSLSMAEYSKQAGITQEAADIFGVSPKVAMIKLNQLKVWHKENDFFSILNKKGEKTVFNIGLSNLY